MGSNLINIIIHVESSKPRNSKVQTWTEQGWKPPKLQVIAGVGTVPCCCSRCLIHVTPFWNSCLFQMKYYTILVWMFFVTCPLFYCFYVCWQPANLHVGYVSLELLDQAKCLRTKPPCATRRWAPAADGKLVLSSLCSVIAWKGHLDTQQRKIFSWTDYFTVLSCFFLCGKIMENIGLQMLFAGNPVVIFSSFAIARTRF